MLLTLSIFLGLTIFSSSASAAGGAGVNNSNLSTWLSTYAPGDSERPNGSLEKWLEPEAPRGRWAKFGGSSQEVGNSDIGSLKISIQTDHEVHLGFCSSNILKSCMGVKKMKAGKYWFSALKLEQHMAKMENRDYIGFQLVDPGYLSDDTLDFIAVRLIDLIPNEPMTIPLDGGRATVILEVIGPKSSIRQPFGH